MRRVWFFVEQRGRCCHCANTMTLEARVPSRRHTPATMATWDHIIPRAVMRALGAANGSTGNVLLACSRCNHAKGAKIIGATALILVAIDLGERFTGWHEAHSAAINTATLRAQSARRRGQAAQRAAHEARADFLRKGEIRNALGERRNAGVKTAIAIGPRPHWAQLLPAAMLGEGPGAKRKRKKRERGRFVAPTEPTPATAWITVDGVRYTPEGYAAAVAAKRERAKQDQARWEREQRAVLADQIAAGNRR